MEREPFGEILTETLQQFWQRKYDDSFDVQWHWKPKNLPPAQSIDFHCNIYLNAVFPAGTRNGALEPIRREFSRSTVPWRRPLQSAYCKLALSPTYAAWFKQATLRVTPPHDALNGAVIVPGNNKLRILDRSNNLAHGVLKHGFPNTRFENEIETRRQVESLGLSTPTLIESDANAGWFTETYVTGTPLNRIGNLAVVAEFTREAVEELSVLTTSTRQETTVGQYLNDVHDRMAVHLEQNHLLGNGDTESILRCVDRLTNALTDESQSGLITAQTHGDFQPANILVNGDQFWIIDWEYSDRRQVDYDLLVFDCQTRRHRDESGNGLAKRLRNFVQTGFTNNSVSTPDRLSNLTSRQTAATVLLLEELDLRISENTNPRFTKLDAGLSVLLTEINSWIDAA